MARYGPLVAVAGLLLAAALAEGNTATPGTTGVLLGAACVTLGAWIATEVWQVVQMHKREDEEHTQ